MPGASWEHGLISAQVFLRLGMYVEGKPTRQGSCAGHRFPGRRARPETGRCLSFNGTSA